MNGARLKQLQDELAQLGPRESIPRTDIARLIRYLESSVELGKLLLIGGSLRVNLGYLGLVINRHLSAAASNSVYTQLVAFTAKLACKCPCAL